MSIATGSGHLHNRNRGGLSQQCNPLLHFRHDVKMVVIGQQHRAGSMQAAGDAREVLRARHHQCGRTDVRTGRIAHNDRSRSGAFDGSSGARIDDVRAAAARDHAVLVVIAGREQRLMPGQLQRCEHAAVGRFDRHAPRPSVRGSQREHVAADVDDRVADAVRAQDRRDLLGRVTFREAVEIERNPAIVGNDGAVGRHADVAHARAFRIQCRDARG